MFNWKKKREIEIYSPINGEIIQIDTIPDKMFANKMLGDGIGFIMNEDTVYSPCEGKVMMIAGTKHAIGIEDKNGVELLIHIGLDTVNLEGEGFKPLVQVGDKVSINTPLIEVNSVLIKEKGIDLTSAMVITNTDDYNFTFEKFGQADSGEKVLTLLKK